MCWRISATALLTEPRQSSTTSTTCGAHVAATAPCHHWRTGFKALPISCRKNTHPSSVASQSSSNSMARRSDQDTGCWDAIAASPLPPRLPLCTVADGGSSSPKDFTASPPPMPTKKTATRAIKIELPLQPPVLLAIVDLHDQHARKGSSVELLSTFSNNGFSHSQGIVVHTPGVVEQKGTTGGAHVQHGVLPLSRDNSCLNHVGSSHSHSLGVHTAGSAEQTYPRSATHRCAASCCIIDAVDPTLQKDKLLVTSPGFLYSRKDWGLASGEPGVAHLPSPQTSPKELQLRHKLEFFSRKESPSQMKDAHDLFISVSSEDVSTSRNAGSRTLSLLASAPTSEARGGGGSFDLAALTRHEVLLSPSARTNTTGCGVMHLQHGASGRPPTRTRSCARFAHSQWPAWHKESSGDIVSRSCCSGAAGHIVTHCQHLTPFGVQSSRKICCRSAQLQGDVEHNPS
mmetsp:Transcript_56791/g.135279  ORF Transcript_56791/g.135279 Transcript_56791/m.135279 type:complete len:458 (-) Transcript_56791:136-1509(-)